MATVGNLVDHAGLRSLTPGAVEKTRHDPVNALYEIDPASPIDPPEGSLVYLPSTVWSSLPRPESLPSALRSEGGIAVVIDNDDCSLPPEFLTECVRQSIPVFLLPKTMPFDQLGAALLPQPDGSPKQKRESGPEAISDLIDGFVGRSGVRGSLVMQGCVLSGSNPPDIDLLTKILARKPVPLKRISNTAAAIHATLPRSGHALVLTNPNRISWDLRRVSRLAEQIDAQAHAIEVTRTARHQSESALIRELIGANVASAALDPWARSLGLEPGTRIRAVSVVVPESAATPIEQVVAALQDLGLRSGGTCVCGAYEDSAYTLITIDGGGASGGAAGGTGFDHHLDVLARLFAQRHGYTPSIGTSSCVLRSSDDLVRGLISARQLADRHARSSRSEGHSVPLPAPLAATLLATEPRLASVLYQALLKPVVDYDEQKGSAYLATLRTFLALDGHWGATAAELGIHINTLRYRLTRIERLTGRGIHATADRADYYLALTLRESARRG